MRFDVFTIFPELLLPYFETSILKRAQMRNLIEIHVHNIRDWTYDRHHTTDDMPFGGGGGMIIKPEPVFTAVEAILGLATDCPVILLTPQGRLLNQKIVQELAREPHIALISGRYEGFDERIRQHLATDEISIGDYVLTGGELPALTIIDSVARLIPGVLGDPEGASQDSHASGLLEYPHYTRPAEFRNWCVPEILVSGDHKRVNEWRREQSILRTWQRRPDLLVKIKLSAGDYKILAEIQAREMLLNDV